MSYNTSPKLNNNGLMTCSFDMDDDTKLYAHLKIDNPAKKKTKEAARIYLDKYLEINSKEINFKYLQTQEIKLSDTRIVKFRQWYKNIPVYGSLATVELDKTNELIGISANSGQPNGISPLPKINETEVESLIREKGYNLADWSITTNLYYYFDSSTKYWRLVYIIITKPKSKFLNRISPSKERLVDYIVDAHTKKIISELPHVRTID